MIRTQRGPWAMALAGAVVGAAGCHEEASESAREDSPPAPKATPVGSRPADHGEPDGARAEAPPKGDPASDGRAKETPPDDPPIHPGGAFFGEPDSPRRLALATEPIAEIEKGTGGRTLAFKITLRDGTVGYYKPEQTFTGAHWHAEVAAYYLDRELGLGRVPPVVGRRMEWSRLRPVAAGDERIDEVVVQEDGTVRGAFIWWVPGGLEPIAPGRGWEKWIRQNGGLGITPYQRPMHWRQELRARADGSGGAAEVQGQDPDRPPAGAPPRPGLPAALSDMIVFDYLTRNIDRWGGHFTNVRTRGEGGPLLFFDNGAAFGPGDHRIGLIDAHLQVLERFRHRTVQAIRELDLESLRARMATDPLAPVLDAHRFEGLEVRRRAVLEHVQDMKTRYGRDEVLCW